MAALAWPIPSADAQMIYLNGQVCWLGGPCPEFKTAPVTARAKAKAKQVAPGKPAKPSAMPTATTARPAPAPADTAHTYHYPTMYRAEAPPLMPPGARRFPPGSEQPYVLVTQGVWYWPGANDFKMPQVPGFEPVIDASRVISW
jgi:hypothetical protein